MNEIKQSFYFGINNLLLTINIRMYACFKYSPLVNCMNLCLKCQFVFLIIVYTFLKMINSVYFNLIFEKNYYLP